MEDFIIDDFFKSDKYEVSINELLFTRLHKKSVDSICKLLDNNGYFGRYKIESFSDKKFGTDVLIKVHIYMPNSAHSYIWPFNTFFNITRNLFGSNRRIPRGVLSDQTMLRYSFLVLSVMFSDNEEEDLSIHDLNCKKAMDIIKEGNYNVEHWAYIICKQRKCIEELNYFDKFIAFISRIGLIKNNRFLIRDKEDAREISSNLFDINYWYNI